MNCNQSADHSGFFLQVSGLFVGTVPATAVCKTPVKATKALCGTVWQLLYIRAYYPHLYAGGMREGEENWVNLHQKLHPAQKPIALLLDLVKETTAPVVIDPYMGSGTTLVACVRLDRPCIGVEIDPAYFDAACERLQDEVEQRAQQRQAEAAD